MQVARKPPRQRHGTYECQVLSLDVAKLLEVAAVALGFAGFADLAAVMDDLVGEVDPAVLRQNDLHQLLLDFLRRFAFGKPETARDAEDVCVDDHAFGLVEGRRRGRRWLFCGLRRGW